MAHPKQPFNPDQPEMPPELPKKVRRRDQPVPDAPAIVPHPGEGFEPGTPQPLDDGGVEQHPVHDSDTEDLGPEGYEDLTDEVAKRSHQRGR